MPKGKGICGGLLPPIRAEQFGLLVMRRFLHVGLNTFQFQRLHGAGLPLNFLLKPIEEFALLNDHAVQLLDLMLEVRIVRFQSVYALGVYVCHPGILPR